jgi:hypothetical protein
LAIHTYSQVDLAALGDFFRQDAEEIQDAGMALDVFAESGHDGRENVLPLLHLDGQYRETHAQLHADRFGAGGEVLEEQEELVPQGGELALWHLPSQVIRYLPAQASQRWSLAGA